MNLNLPFPRFHTLVFLLLIILLMNPAVLAGDEYTGQFVMELAPDRENLDQVVFQPVRDPAKYKLAKPVEPGAKVTFTFLYNGNTEKLEIPALLVEPQNGAPYIQADVNLDKLFDENEKFPLKQAEEDNPYLLETIVNEPLKSGVFKMFPLFVRFFKDIRRNNMGEGERLAQQSSDVFAQGYVDVQGKKTLVAYGYNPRSKKIN